MPFVLDASVFASWILDDEHHAVADFAYARLDFDTAVAPILWWFEVRNLLIVNERRGRIDATKSAEALRLAAACPVALDTSADEGALISLARRHKLTIYDAAYLELALRLQCPLATLDAALAKAAEAEGALFIAAGR